MRAAVARVVVIRRLERRDRRGWCRSPSALFVTSMMTTLGATISKTFGESAVQLMDDVLARRGGLEREWSAWLRHGTEAWTEARSRRH